MSDPRKMLDDYNAFNSGKSDPDFNKSSSSRIPSALRQSEKNPPVRSKEEQKVVDTITDGCVGVLLALGILGYSIIFVLWFYL